MINNTKLSHSPWRKIFNEAFTYEKKYGKQLKKWATKLEGEIEKDSIVQLDITYIISTKVDSRCLIYIATKKIICRKKAPTLCVACECSIIKGTIQRHLLRKVP